MDELNFNEVDEEKLDCVISSWYTAVDLFTSRDYPFLRDYVSELLEIIDNDHSVEKCSNLLRTLRDCQKSLESSGDIGAEELKLILSTFEFSFLSCFDGYQEDMELYRPFILDKLAEQICKEDLDLISKLRELISDDNEYLEVISQVIFINNSMRNISADENYEQILENIHSVMRQLSNNTECAKPFLDCCFDILRADESFMNSLMGIEDVDSAEEKYEYITSLREGFYEHLEAFRDYIQ